MEAIGMKSYGTYKKHFDEIVKWGFFKVHEYSKNQHSSNVIELTLNVKALDKALDKALTKHASKQRQRKDESTGSIDKQETSKPNNQEQEKAMPVYFKDGALNDVFNKWLYACANEVKVTVRKEYGQMAIEALAMKLNQMPVNKAINKVRQSLENGWVTLRDVDQNSLVKPIEQVITERGTIAHNQKVVAL